jgi:hypothetical protein
VGVGQAILRIAICSGRSQVIAPTNWIFSGRRGFTSPRLHSIFCTGTPHGNPLFPTGGIAGVGLAGCTKLLTIRPLRWRSLPPLSSLDCWFVSLGTAGTAYLTRLTVHCCTWPQNPTLTYFGFPSPQKRIPAGVGRRGRRLMYSIIKANELKRLRGQQFSMYHRVPHPNLFWVPFTPKRIPAGVGRRGRRLMYNIIRLTV